MLKLKSFCSIRKVPFVNKAASDGKFLKAKKNIKRQKWDEKHLVWNFLHAEKISSNYHFYPSSVNRKKL